MRHTCKAPNCTKQISTDLLMCPRHWAQVPRTIQVRVVRSWSALGRNCNKATHDIYAAARDEAIKAVTPPSASASLSQQGRGLGEGFNRTNNTARTVKH